MSVQDAHAVSLAQGWDIDTLQNAITGCDNNTPDTAAGITASCPFFTVREMSLQYDIPTSELVTRFKMPLPRQPALSRHT